ncbi:DUF1697 domain-containing protein [Alicyclobacillus sp. SO9]|uniref:DUF1697 domain-containing protein n=1 Tax=Alicyclobacillus sp. SO9 TaxID=2665646 RepID=UPI0018E7CFCA|nr:DUF1697 domain-containing protein [Alicyclobacillus sp. SO9]QQE77251.1 DUF1697 domain-containing protein [Alicyclobacillus sp. SO9]
MTIYVALLRGINVGGHNQIKMADLRRMFESVGINRVQTYIQSGNVLFDSDENVTSLRQRIEQELEKTFSVSTTIQLRTSVELEQIITDCPFSEEERGEAEASTDAVTFYVSLLLDSPAPEDIDQLNGLRSEIDDFRVRGREVYLLLRQGIRNSKLANSLIRLKTPSTVRNWKTMNKLNVLAKSMET